MNSQPVTQTQMDSQGMDLHHTQTQVHELDSLVRDNFASQEPELFELTQDQGLEDHTPLKERFIEAPTSAISTVPQTSMQPTQPVSHDSPLVRKGKLRRRLEVINEDKSDSEVDGGQTDEFGFGTSAFGAMKEAAKKEKKRLAKEEFNRKKSKAKEMVEEQAEESEDEYAGLGGADGEESDGDWDKASVKEMIDDEKNENEAEDERKLAALHA
jgi:mediator of replication checkpoint protein 1